MGAPVRLAAGVALAAIAIAQAPGSARAASAEHSFPGMYAGGQALPVLASTIDVKVEGPFAQATITQRFRNPLDHAIEAVYIFPLPDDASVSAMVIHTGSRTITAKIEDRAAARARYEAAVAAGASAALLEEERSDVFTQQVTAIPAGAEVSVELRFDTAAVRRANAWELALPLVVGPRSVPGTPTGKPSAGTGHAPDTDRAPDASRVTPEAGGDGTPVTVKLHLAAAAAIDSVEVPSHDATVEIHGKGAEVSLADARGDHDVVVRWRTKGDGLAAITDAAGFVAVIVPAPAVKTQSHDWIVVADTSQAMAGDGIVLVRRAVRALADRMGAHDRIAIVDAAGAKQLELGGAAAVRTWADSMAAVGAPDLAAALKAARASAAKAKHPVIVLVSDALAADDAEIERAADGGPPILALGIGAAPNRALIDRLAARTQGAARYLAAADDANDMIAALLAMADAPRAASKTLDWGVLVVDALPSQVPALAPGDAAIVIAKVDRPGKARVAMGARGLDLPAVWTSEATRSDDVAKASVLARRWARAKLDALVASGASADDIRALGLRYGLITPETALVAVGTDVVVKGGVSTSVSIPVAMPAGMKWQAVYRNPTTTATTTATQKPPADKDHAEKRPEKPEPPRGGKETERTGEDRTNTKVTIDGTTTTETGGEVDEGAATAPNAPTSPPPQEGRREVAAETGAAYDSEEVLELAGETTSIAEHRWGFSFTLGAGALVDPQRDALGLASLRVAHGMTPRLAFGIDLTALAAPGADRDRYAVALMAALLRGGMLDGRLSLDLGLGPELASDPGLGYEIGARYGRRVGFVLRWDGAVLVGQDKTFHRASATAGLSVDF